MIVKDYSDNVFINCPYDDKYKGLMNAIVFVVVVMGFIPRLAMESSDCGQSRIDKIIELIQGAKYSIHDLSRMVSTKPGEYFRLNMALELGIDFGCKNLLGSQYNDKKFLILEEDKHRFRNAISDLSGMDIKAHDGRCSLVIRCVRDWFAETVGLQSVPSAERISADYMEDFHPFFLEKAKRLGFTEKTYARDMEMRGVIRLVQEWRQIKPLYCNIVQLEMGQQQIEDSDTA